MVAGKIDDQLDAASDQLDAASVGALIEALIPDDRERLNVEGEIARGGMAAVHLGLDRALGRRVAMKLILPEHQHSMLAVRSFVREAQITGQLDHPNIVPVHELGVDERGRLFFTMKLVDGRTLYDLIEALRSTHDRIDERGFKVATAVSHEDLLRLLDVFFKVLDAVAFAHSRGVTHCDIKPENVMVGDYGQVYLMDWGIAKVMPEPVGVNPLARSNRVRNTLPLMPVNANLIMGTPAYMSPEQARGDQRRVDERSDIFALGAMLFEILTGHPPYQGRSAVDVLLQAEEASAKLPEQLPIARELRRIVAVAMAPSARDRYQRVEDMQADLRGFMRGGGNFPRQVFAPNEWIIRENEVGDAAYILISGRCEVFKQIDGKAESLRTLGPGDVFGETAILASTPRTASVVALTEVVAVTVTADVLEREVDAMKPWMGAFIRALAQRFSEVADRPRSGPSSARLAVPAEARGTGRTQRQLQALRPGQGSLRDPAQVANQAMMLLKSWGKWDRDLGNAMSLERASGALATICGLTQAEVLTTLRSFKQFVIEPKHDSISLRDDRSLVQELARVLKI
ncbi:Serine/threonine-protein kinase PrkC [Enhygromyxa salina]|uniref:Serine/threonine-protein kinase PrkC n=1 Tax=Enhygromyxa salina TaxID=215803 RepID=A0A2S9YBR6_9BACT|nr:cyclic nucleotide-binding domain-containing protein [Enhygromyxa salina]PRQ02545.1 Serine/threonine-protein kinase PrkC [Enhygromyxa salina]